MADVLLVWEMNTACVMLLQGVNEKPFSCQCHTITPSGSYLKVCLCDSLCISMSMTRRACSLYAYMSSVSVSMTVRYYACVCLCTFGGGLCMSTCVFARWNELYTLMSVFK